MASLTLASTPNLFKYATSELSQDAFICWLIEWARIENSQENKDLHQLGVRFVDAFFNKSHSEKPQSGYHSIDIVKQFHGIDVLCIINHTHAIIIEDKVNSSQHSNQLNRYYEKISEKFSKEHIIPIYFKTGDEHAYPDDYHLYHRSDFLALLNSYKGDNHILIDYRNSLTVRANNINSYLTNSIHNWSYESWIGFYIALNHKGLANNWWGNIPSRSGSFIGYRWSNHAFKDEDYYIDLYLFIEQNRGLKVKARFFEGAQKIQVSNEKAKELRTKYHQLISNLPQFTRPKRFGLGKDMVLAVLKEDYRVSHSNNTLDLDSTYLNLKQVSKDIDRLIAKYLEN